MNPYASFLGQRDPLETITTTANQLSDLLEKLGADGPNYKPAPEKWSAREVLCHLADTEIVFAFRLRQALSETGHVIQPFDQDGWAKVYSAFDATSALNVFRTVREWNVTLIRSLPAEAFSRPLSHPERGPMTLRTVVETMGGHDLNHIRRIEAISDLVLQ